MTPFHWFLLYALSLILTLGLSRLLPKGSHAQKLASHAFNILSAGLVAGAKWLVGKML